MYSTMCRTWNLLRIFGIHCISFILLKKILLEFMSFIKICSLSSRMIARLRNISLFSKVCGMNLMCINHCPLTCRNSKSTKKNFELLSFYLVLNRTLILFALRSYLERTYLLLVRLMLELEEQLSHLLVSKTSDLLLLGIMILLRGSVVIIVLAGVPIMVVVAEVVVVVVVAAALGNVLIVVVLITHLIFVGSFMANQLGLIMLLLMGITPPLFLRSRFL
jgi:hypothetical protein